MIAVDHTVMRKCQGFLKVNKYHDLAHPQAAHADKKIVQLSCYVAERMLQEVTMLDFLPSVVACCAIYVARKNMGRNCWSPTLEKYTKYQVQDLMPCLTEVSSRLSSKGLSPLSCFLGKSAAFDLTRRL